MHPSRRDELNKKFGRKGNLNKDINIHGGLKTSKTRNKDYERSRKTTKKEWKKDQSERRLDNRRQRGVDRFWSEERKRLQKGEPGTRNWSPKQRDDILSGSKKRRPKHDGKTIEGHHKKNVKKYPELADDPDNIYPATELEHFERWHGGTWQNDTQGVPNNPLFPEEF